MVPPEEEKKTTIRGYAAHKNYKLEKRGEGCI